MKEKQQQLKEEVKQLLAAAEAADEQEDRQYGSKRGDELPEELRRRETRLATIKEAKKVLEQRARDKAAGMALPGPIDQNAASGQSQQRRLYGHVDQFRMDDRPGAIRTKRVFSGYEFSDLPVCPLIHSVKEERRASSGWRAPRDGLLRVAGDQMGPERRRSSPTVAPIGSYTAIPFLFAHPPDCPAPRSKALDRPTSRVA